MHDSQQHQTHHAFPAASNAPATALDMSKGLDVREVVWLKLQVLKDKYLQDLMELYNMLTQRSTMPMPPEQQQKLKHYKDVVQRMIPYLTAAKDKIPVEFSEDKTEAFEKQIVNIMQTFKRRMLIPPQQPGPLSQKQLHLKEALQSVQQQHAQLLQQWQQRLLQQQMLQQQQQLLQHQQQILQQQEVLQKHLLQQQQFFQQQKVLQEQQQQEDMIAAVTGCFSRLPLN